MNRDDSHLDSEIARLSAELRAHVEKLSETAARLEEAQRKSDEQIIALQRDVLHYKGIVGGAMFVLSGMWAVLIFFKDRIFGDK